MKLEENAHVMSLLNEKLYIGGSKLRNIHQFSMSFKSKAGKNKNQL